MVRMRGIGFKKDADGVRHIENVLDISNIGYRKDGKFNSAGQEFYSQVTFWLVHEIMDVVEVVIVKEE